MRKELLFQKGRVDKTFNINFEVKYIDPAYSVFTDNERFIQDTGLLKIFEISSSNTNEPRFIGRWDQNKQLLDIDIENVDKLTKLNWRKKKNGYLGHHTDLIKPEHRTFGIHIELQDRLFLKGEIFFNVNHRVEFGNGRFDLK